MGRVGEALDVSVSEPRTDRRIEDIRSWVGRKLPDYLLLAKVRLSLMVVASALVSYWLAAGPSADMTALGWFGVGAFLTIAGANAFNQIAERSLDRLMQRTAGRPLPSGRMGVGEAVVVAASMSASGLGILTSTTNALTVSLAASATAVYLLVYTPLKRMTHWSTLAGAISGAIPALMGWSAAQGTLEVPAWSVFGIVFLWQFPHTWSIVSAYKEDYLRAGYRVLPLVDNDGSRTRGQVIGFTVALTLVSLLPAAFGLAGRVYVVGALLGGLTFVAFAGRFGFRRTRKSAGQLMAASLVYMPLILSLLLLDHRRA